MIQALKKEAKIYVAGHRGMVGSAIVRQLKTHGYQQIIVRTSKELDLRNQQAVAEFFQAEKPDYAFFWCAKNLLPNLQENLSDGTA